MKASTVKRLAENDVREKESGLFRGVLHRFTNAQMNIDCCTFVSSVIFILEILVSVLYIESIFFTNIRTTTKGCILINGLRRYMGRTVSP